MCEINFTRLRDDLVGRIRTIEPDYLDDYTRLLTVMLDGPLIDRHLVALNEAVERQPPGGNNPQDLHHQLSPILSLFEQRCSFRAQVLVPDGILPAADFLHFIRLGYVYKDFGAGVRHGEFTHRLQWHVILRTMTDNFRVFRRDGWLHTPFQLYVRLGEPDNAALWGWLFDQPGPDRPDDEDMRHPDVFHRQVLENVNIRALHDAVSRRELKRRHQAVDAIERYYEADDFLVQIPPQFQIGQPQDARATYANFLALDHGFRDMLVGQEHGAQFEEAYYVATHVANYFQNKVDAGRYHRVEDGRAVYARNQDWQPADDVDERANQSTENLADVAGWDAVAPAPN
jgi:hypothetical protein